MRVIVSNSGCPRGYRHPVLPDIRTEHLQLRRMRPDDLDGVLALYDDPAANAWDPIAMGPDEVRAKFAEWLAAWEQTGLSYWIADDLASGELAGMGGIRGGADGGLNLAYRFHREFWGRGYATEIARAAVEWAERHLPDAPVTVITTPTNTQSLRVAEKLGFAVVEELDTHGFPEVLLRRQP